MAVFLPPQQPPSQGPHCISTFRIKACPWLWLTGLSPMHVWNSEIHFSPDHYTSPLPLWLVHGRVKLLFKATFTNSIKPHSLKSSFKSVFCGCFILQHQPSVCPSKCVFMQKFLLSLKAGRQPWKGLIWWDVELLQDSAKQNFRHFLHSFFETSVPCSLAPL